MKTETLPGSIYLSISTGNNETAMATAMIMLLLSAATLVVSNLFNRPIGSSRHRSQESRRLLERKGEKVGSAKEGNREAVATSEPTASTPGPAALAPEPTALTPGSAAPTLLGAGTLTQEPGCLVEVRDVSLSLGDFKLQDADMSVEPGQMFAILGRTGSGKTVLLETIAGAYQLDSGSVLLDGKDVWQTPAQKRGMGIVYQDCALFPHLSVYENIAYGLRMRKESSTRTRELVDQAMELFGISHLAQCYPGTISGGEAQRTALARALVLQPRLLLLDEPFSALDPVTKQALYETVRSIHRSFSCTIVFVTHDFHEAETLAERVAIILDGRIRTTVPARELFQSEFEPEVMSFLGRA